VIDISESIVDAMAPNANAAGNARGLLLKGKLSDLRVDAEGTLIFCSCKGSGKSDYQTSVDFLEPGNPVPRCSCPSRQFPCKHALALMLAYCAGKSAFSVAEIPEDVASKREKAAKRAEKRKEKEDTPAKPRKVNKSALKKKIAVQLEGLELLEKIVRGVLKSGMGNVTPRTFKEMEEQAKRLEDSYLPGARNALRGFINLFRSPDGDWLGEPTEKERVYTLALDHLGRLKALRDRGRAYLEARLKDPEMKPDTESAIAAWLGEAWKLEELGKLGLVERNAELAQLAFHPTEDLAGKMFVETGYWLNLGSGAIQKTVNYRPFRAAKHIKADDSFFDVAKIPELYIYPGDMNPRVRWKSMTARPLTEEDLHSMAERAERDFKSLAKRVKNQLKAPLADKHPLALVRFERIGEVDGTIVIEDAEGARIALADMDGRTFPPTLDTLRYADAGSTEIELALLVFHHNLDTGLTRAQPLALVKENGITRLVY